MQDGKIKTTIINDAEISDLNVSSSFTIVVYIFMVFIQHPAFAGDISLDEYITHQRQIVIVRSDLV